MRHLPLPQLITNEIRRGENWKWYFSFRHKDRFSLLPLPCPIITRCCTKIETRRKKQRQFNRKALISSSAHVCAIGEVARSDGGIEKESWIKPEKGLVNSAFIGRQSRKEDRGKRARTVWAKRVPQTPTATVATSQKPDNCGGASWFVLLAAEKNEQIT